LAHLETRNSPEARPQVPRSAWRARSAAGAGRTAPADRPRTGPRPVPCGRPAQAWLARRGPGLCRGDAGRRGRGTGRARRERREGQALQAGHPQRLRPAAAREPLRPAAMRTLLLLLALVLLRVDAGWLWTAPGVRKAGRVEVIMSLA